jgi:hypothetical protein
MHILNGQLMFLGACYSDEIMTSSRIKQDDNGMFVQRKCTYEDLLTLRNVLHGGVGDVTGLWDGRLLPTRCVALLWCGAVMSKVAGMTTVEAGVGGSSHSRWCRQTWHMWWWR